ncbi:LysR family transcriptional regulator [Glaciecola sp. 1036]|uniref:LysR family transcriptional regulator n=1 Tax=Alteromonadaceae TaxID=72275 RepID=UPI003D04EA9E
MQLDDLAIFVTIAELGNFSRAAESLGLPKATLSRRFSDFEKRIGIILIKRSTRSFSLTAEGQRLFAISRQSIKQALEVESSINTPSNEIQGTVELCCDENYMQHLILPYVQSFQQQYNAINISFQTAGSLTTSKFDVKISTQAHDAKEYDMHRLTLVRHWLVAAPSLLAKFNQVTQSEDIANLPFLLQSKSITPLVIGEQSLDLNWKLMIEDVQTLLDLTSQGVGIAVLPDFLIQSHVKNGGLKVLLPQFPLPAVQTQIMIEKQASISPAAQALLEFLKQEVPAKHLLRMTG